MRKLIALTLAVLFVITASNVIFTNVYSADGNTDSYVVQLKDGVSPTDVLGKHGIVPKFIYKKAVNGFAGKIPPGLLKKVEVDPDVLSISIDRVVKAEVKPVKPPKPGDGDSTQVVSSGVTRIDAEPGALSYTGAGVGVAIVDTGIDKLHADLNVATDCFYAPHSTSCQDDQGHGTHVAGIVAALNNDLDTVGVAPDVTLYAVKVLDNEGYGEDSDIIAGLDWVMLNGAALNPPVKVVNMSLGREGTVDDNPALHTAVQNLYDAGISIVVSAGNDANLEVTQHIPSAYPEVMAVASTTAADGSFPKNGLCAGLGIAKDTASFFTTDGAEVTISAPGAYRENVKVSCTINSDGILSLQLGGGTTRMSGTSMSSPHVAGVVALMYEKAATMTPADAKTAIQLGADLVGVAPLNSPTSTYTYDGVREGVLSAFGALDALDIVMAP